MTEGGREWGTIKEKETESARKRRPPVQLEEKEKIRGNRIPRSALNVLKGSQTERESIEGKSGVKQAAKKNVRERITLKKNARNGGRFLRRRGGTTGDTIARAGPSLGKSGRKKCSARHAKKTGWPKERSGGI